MIGRVARRMQQHGMALAWSTWEGRVEEAVAERQNEEWRQHTMAKVVRRIRNQGLVSAFGRWSGNVAEACRKRRVMRKVLLQLYNRRLSGAFERWLDSVRELKAAAEEEARKQRQAREKVGSGPREGCVLRQRLRRRRKSPPAKLATPRPRKVP